MGAGFWRVTPSWPLPVPGLPIPGYPRGFANLWHALTSTELSILIDKCITNLSNLCYSYGLVGHDMGNPWVTQPLPAPTPMWNPYPCSRVQVSTGVGMGTCHIMSPQFNHTSQPNPAKSHHHHPHSMQHQHWERWRWRLGGGALSRPPKMVFFCFILLL